MKLPLLLRASGATLFLANFGSLALWLADKAHLFNPFASLLLIVASPFLYMMGRVIKDDPRQENTD